MIHRLLTIILFAMLQYDPQAEPGAVVTCGNARFTVLTSRLIRMEWADDARFEDRATLAVVNRRLEVPSYRVRKTRDGVVITTKDLTLCYKGPGRFSEKNLSVTFTMADSRAKKGVRKVTWTPGMDNLVFGFLVIVFTYFYTAVTVNPTMMAEDMKKNGGFIPGVKPGKKTAEYLDDILTRVTLPGAFFLAFIACMPAIANVFGVNNQFASFFGGTSLLIMVGVILDTLQQIESYLLMRHYDGLMKTGRLTGRSGM